MYSFSLLKSSWKVPLHPLPFFRDKSLTLCNPGTPQIHRSTCVSASQVLGGSQCFQGFMLCLQPVPTPDTGAISTLNKYTEDTLASSSCWGAAGWVGVSESNSGLLHYTDEFSIPVPVYHVFCYPKNLQSTNSVGRHLVIPSTPPALRLKGQTLLAAANDTRWPFGFSWPHLCAFVSLCIVSPLCSTNIHI